MQGNQYKSEYEKISEPKSNNAPVAAGEVASSARLGAPLLKGSVNLISAGASTITDL